MSTWVFVLLFVVANSAIWVYFDASRLRDERHTGIGPLGVPPQTWAAAVFLLWPAAFPYYLNKRPQVDLLEKRSGPPPRFVTEGLTPFALIAGLLGFGIFAGLLVLGELQLSIVGLVVAAVGIFGGRRTQMTREVEKVELGSIAFEQVGFAPGHGENEDGTEQASPEDLQRYFANLGAPSAAGSTPASRHSQVDAPRPKSAAPPRVAAPSPPQVGVPQDGPTPGVPYTPSLPGTDVELSPDEKPPLPPSVSPQVPAPRPAAPRPSAPRPSAPRPFAPRPAAPQPSAPRPAAPRPAAPQPAAPSSTEPPPGVLYTPPPLGSPPPARPTIAVDAPSNPEFQRNTAAPRPDAPPQNPAMTAPIPPQPVATAEPVPVPEPSQPVAQPVAPYAAPLVPPPPDTGRSSTGRPAGSLAYVAKAEKRNPVPWILGAVLLLAALGVAAWFWMGEGEEEEPLVSAETLAAKGEAGPPPAPARETPKRPGGKAPPKAAEVSQGSSEPVSPEVMGPWTESYAEWMGPLAIQIEEVDFDGISRQGCSSLQRALRGAQRELGASPDGEVQSFIEPALLILNDAADACRGENEDTWASSILEAKRLIHQAQVLMDERYRFAGISSLELESAIGVKRSTESISGRWLETRGAGIPGSGDGNFGDGGFEDDFADDGFDEEDFEEDFEGEDFEGEDF